MWKLRYSTTQTSLCGQICFLYYYFPIPTPISSIPVLNTSTIAVAIVIIITMNNFQQTQLSMEERCRVGCYMCLVRDISSGRLFCFRDFVPFADRFYARAKCVQQPPASMVSTGKDVVEPGWKQEGSGTLPEHIAVDAAMDSKQPTLVQSSPEAPWPNRTLNVKVTSPTGASVNSSGRGQDMQKRAAGESVLKQAMARVERKVVHVPTLEVVVRD